MKNIIASVLVIVLTFGFAGCSSDEEPATPTQTVTVSAEPEAETVQALSDEEYADLVRQNTTYFDSFPDSEIVEGAATICEAFDAGVSIDEIFDIVIDSGVDIMDTGFLFGAGVQNYCPEHVDELESLG